MLRLPVSRWLAFGVLAFFVLLPGTSVRGDGVKRLALLEFELVQGVKIDRTYFSDLARGAVCKAAPHLSVMTRQLAQG